MASQQSDINDLIGQQRFLNEVEQGIRVVNRQIIHDLIPVLNKETFTAFAASVGRIRAQYLKLALEFAALNVHQLPSRERIAELRTRREMFEEALGGFDALRHAIERGYVDVEESEASEPKPA